MLRIVTGRFHPHLESALVHHIRRAKTPDPVAPLAILVPSKELAGRVRRLIAVEHGLALLNVHILTFHQLALRLWDEERERGGSPSPLQVVDELFFEQLIRHLVRNRLQELTPLHQIGHSSGTWGALWSTVRDLKDAGVEPAVALRALREGCFGDDDSAWLEALFSLHAAMQEAARALHVGTLDDLAQAVRAFVPVSRFIASLQHAFYYGFYDLTQVQLDMFEAVSRIAPTTLFFPLDDDPSFDFARRFFERYIQPLAPAPDTVLRAGDPQPGDSSPARPVPELFVRSVVGTEEELATVCRTILDLAETHGYRFDEIGVVARSLDPYRTALPSVFERHRIPFTSTAGTPLMHEPLCKTLLQLASLTLNDWYGPSVVDAVSSPLYRSEQFESHPERIRPDLWRLVVPALHIVRGIEEWARLEIASRSSVEIAAVDDERSSTGSLWVPQEIVRCLWDEVNQLQRECAELPERGTVAQLVESMRALATRHLRRPSPAEGPEENARDTRLLLVWEAVDRVLAQLAQLDVLGDPITWAEFVELLIHVVERTTVPVEPMDHRGVAVLDVMAARGLPFRALFVLGLNEKVFPRYIREDPFLRDQARRVLDETLGFKIDEKLAGYDEEELLLTLLRQAAGDRLILSFQRADDHGRALAPSPYVGEVARLCRLDERVIDAVPRRLTDRMARRPGLKALVPTGELAQWLAMNGQDAAPLLRTTGRDHESFRFGTEALRRIEDDQPALTAYDGLTGPLAAHWTKVLDRGLAPTPLERYARCPFQYFSADVLRLEPVRQPLAQELDAAVLGTVCHAALRRCYERLLPTGWPAEPVTDDTVEWCIHSAVEEAAADYESRHHTGHHVLWEMAKDTIISLVAAAVEADEAAQAGDHFIPVAFEVEAEGMFPQEGGSDAAPMRIRGRVDRVDRHRSSGEIRVVDYKFKRGGSIKAEDRHLVQAALRGVRLQPPLYTCLDIPGYGKPGTVQLFFLAPRWTPPIARSSFAATVWASATGARLRHTVTTLTDGIRAGRFFILPGGYCDTCEFRVACRREHGPTWWRSYRAPEPKALKTICTLRAKDE
jgi:ATP-dependent helicase/nuclease subunit B